MSISIAQAATAIRPNSDLRTLVLGADAVIFDVDGTLIDSVDLHAEAWSQAFAAFGLIFPLSAIRAEIGKGGDQLMPVFLDEETVKAQGAEIDAFRSDLFRRDFLTQVRGFPEVRALFDFLSAAGVTTALGSSAKQAELEVYKQAAGIDDLDLIEATADDAARSKPYPDIFNATLASLGLPPDKVLVVGDTPHDVEAANGAHLRTIGLLCGGFSEASLMDAGAVAVLQDPAALLAALRP